MHTSPHLLTGLYAWYYLLLLAIICCLAALAFWLIFICKPSFPLVHVHCNPVYIHTGLLTYTNYDAYADVLH